MSMSMSMVPKMIMGMACTVCGHCMDSDHATTESIEDAKIHVSQVNALTDLPVRYTCPKCGYNVSATWFLVVTRYKTVIATEKPNKKSQIIAGPFPKWLVAERKKAFQSAVPKVEKVSKAPPYCVKVVSIFQIIIEEGGRGCYVRLEDGRIFYRNSPQACLHDAWSEISLAKMKVGNTLEKKFWQSPDCLIPKTFMKWYAAKQKADEAEQAKQEITKRVSDWEDITRWFSDLPFGAIFSTGGVTYIKVRVSPHHNANESTHCVSFATGFKHHFSECVNPDNFAARIMVDKV